MSPMLASVMTLASGPLDHVLPHTMFWIGPVKVTNHMVMLTLAAIVLVLLMRHVAKQIAITGDRPDDYVTKGRVAHMVEVLLIYLKEEMARPALGNLTEKYIGYIWTTFFFILTCNLLGLLPLAELFGVAFGIEHLGGTATGNLAVTAMLASVSFFVIIYAGIKEHGIKYFAHFAPVPFTPIGMAPIAILLIVLEVVGMFVKPFALCMRLFANMLAGHMVLAALIGLIFMTGTVAGYFIAVPVLAGSTLFMLLEVFVAFLQAFIFTFLTVLFIAQGAVHEHEPHEEHVPHDELEDMPLHEAVETETDPTVVASL